MLIIIQSLKVSLKKIQLILNNWEPKIQQNPAISKILQCFTFNRNCPDIAKSWKYDQKSGGKKNQSIESELEITVILRHF